MVPDQSNPIEKILTHFAERLRDAPGARRLVHRSKTARRIPEPLLADLTALIVQLDDVQLIGSDIALELIDIACCETRHADAAAFARTLKQHLRRDIDRPLAAKAARAEFAARVAWWRMALDRAAELCRWPAIALMEGSSGA